MAARDTFVIAAPGCQKFLAVHLFEVEVVLKIQLRPLHPVMVVS